EFRRVLFRSRIGGLARPRQRTGYHRGNGHVAKTLDQALHLRLAGRVERSARRPAGEIVVDGAGVRVTDEKESRHASRPDAAPGGGSQCAAKASISRSVAPKSPRKQTARS